MRPDVVTFWHGPLDRLRQTCLRSPPAGTGWFLARLDHIAIQRFFPDAADGAPCRPVARRRRPALQTSRDRSGKTLLRLGAAAAARQLRALSAVAQLHRRGVRRPDGAGRIGAGLAGAAASPDLHAAPVAPPIEPSPRYPDREL